MARRRHPDPQSFDRVRFEVSHLVFELVDHPEHGKTFALFAGDPDARPMLFSGHVNVGGGMGTQLRRLAHAIDDLEAT